MNNMFEDASEFNQNINNWNTSKVTNMGGIFRQAIDFNQPLNNWNTSNVTNICAIFVTFEVFQLFNG
jgi:surface protein